MTYGCSTYFVGFPGVGILLLIVGRWPGYGCECMLVFDAYGAVCTGCFFGGIG